VNYYTFLAEGCGCHQYLVLAKDKSEAMKKFIIWQNNEFSPAARWPEDIIKDEDNWEIDNQLHIIQ